MHCTFDGGFTEGEKERIRASLRKIDEVAEAAVNDDGPTWQVGRVKDDLPQDGAGQHAPDPLTLRARNTVTGVEVWGRSVDHLVEKIEETAALVRRHCAK